MKHYRYKYIF